MCVTKVVRTVRQKLSKARRGREKPHKGRTLRWRDAQRRAATESNRQAPSSHTAQLRVISSAHEPADSAGRVRGAEAAMTVWGGVEGQS